jgi:lycopene beta-cyclase
MSGRADLDVVIVGAGAAGLSLAVRLAPTGLRIEILDAREGFSDDRTFSGFHFPGSHPFEGAIQHRYSEVTLFDGRGEVRRSLGDTPYVSIAGDLFYAAALRRLALYPNVRLTLGTSVLEVRAKERSAEVLTSRGSIEAQLVVQASGRFRARKPAARELAQVFLGRVVRTERPIFSPDRATLMDFRQPQARGAHFIYVLPESERVALVEDTYFTTESIDDAAHDRAIADWLAAAGAGATEVLRTERGSLPMTTAEAEAEPSPRIIPFGLAAGAAKGSTGYAFAFIQRHADALAQAIRSARLANHPTLLPKWPAVRGPTAHFFDAVFLRFVHEATAQGHPEAVGSALVGLFRDADTASVARFLSERASPLDLVRVMAAMPTSPFLRSAVAQLRP